MINTHEVEWTSQQISDFWDYQSHRPSIDHIYFSATHGRQIAKRTRRWLAGKRPTRVLDLGCGTGAFLKHLASVVSGLSLSGADFSEASIQTARSTCAAIRPIPELKAVSGYPTDWQAGSFDTVYIIEVVEHLHDDVLHSVLKEASRLLAKDGHLIITTPNSEDLEKQHTCCPNCGTTFHVWQHVRNWSAASLASFVLPYGFELSAARATFLDPMPVRITTWLARAVGLSNKRPPHLLGVFRKP